MTRRTIGHATRSGVGYAILGAVPILEAVPISGLSGKGCAKYMGQVTHRALSRAREVGRLYAQAPGVAVASHLPWIRESTVRELEPKAL